MGMCTSKDDTTGSLTYQCQDQDQVDFMQKVRLLQQEMSMLLQQREEERKGYERDAAGFARREGKWKEERRKLRDEVRRLRKCLKEEGKGEEGYDGKEGKMLEGIVVSSLVVEKMREERARRDEAIEKWKMLYLAIKNELDDLIERTHQQGGAICWRGAEENFTEALKRELNTKDEKIQALKAQIAAMEQEEYKRKREFDILRQSLRIVTNKTKAIS
ncbi:hypothetical protein AKJ16_DCAP22094 [Drosera capensis]